MNILQVLPELKSGGVETGTIDLAKELIRHGHRAVVISNGGKLVDELTACGGKHYNLPVHEKNPFTIISMIGSIKEIIRKEGIEIVHARSRIPGFSAFFAARSVGIPFITTCHGYYSKHFLSRVMGWGRFVIASGNVVARHMIKSFGVPRERIRLIPRGVDLEKFTYIKPDISMPKKEYTIGVIGRITPIKGHIYFIRAISKVVRLMPNIKILIIGDAPASKPKYRQELEVLIRRLSLTKYISFLGICHNIPEKMKKLDLLVMPSIGEETFGRVIVEAQASGVPVIASRIGGIVDLIKDGENGILTAPRDWSGLSEAIIRVLKDRDFRQRLSRKGRSGVEKNFTLMNMYKKTVKVYSEALHSYRILIIKWSALGDIILSLPALKAIKDKFPKAHISLLTSREGLEFIKRYPYVKEFFMIRQTGGIEGIGALLNASSELRRSSFDLICDLQNNKKSHLISFLSFTRRRVGYKSGNLDFLLTEGIDGARMNIPPVEHQFRLLKQLGIDSAPELGLLMISKQESEYADRLISESWIGKAEALVGISLNASRKWRTKSWPAEKLAKLCDILAQSRIRIVITGTKEDSIYAKRVLLLTRSKPFDITGRTSVTQLAAVIKKCQVFITSDSAPMHIALFCGVGLVALFGPTDPKRHLQPHGRYRIICKRLKCSPCYKPKCNDPICMKKITPEEVAFAVKELLKG
jgi:lipopolysaccharide heptosyltransferase II